MYILPRYRQWSDCRLPVSRYTNSNRLQ